jgi:pSer/pThr/pTyr-binding forkhead associated (FHA) protein
MTIRAGEEAMSTRYILKGPSGKSLEITDTIVAGRNPDSDLVLVEGHPSRRHAQLTNRDGHVWLEDLGSANGTYVNDQAITTSVQLKSGDRIRFDEELWELTVVTPPSDSDAATVLREPRGDGHQTVVARTDDRPKPPGSWADPDMREGQGTRLFDPKDLQKLRQTNAVEPPQEDVDAPYLSVKSGRHAGQRLKLRADQQTNVWSIGSDPDQQIVITDDGVSGFHAKIVNEGSRWKLIDQMSANGSFVNDRKSNISYLTSGDRIRFGPVECVFQLPSKSRQGGRSGKLSTWMIALASFVVTAAILAILWWQLR